MWDPLPVDAMGWACPDCGFRITGGHEPGVHGCDEITFVAHQVRRFESAFQAFLETPAGRFEEFYARRLIGLLDERIEYVERWLKEAA